ncbi:hypothetical protein AKJ45_01330 [candidate division MSBL1 archaeon SCGC-AAA261F19]|uniref:Uncharacterized protein n=1 Tax=candidate division MSBL1 archaeon SCGC-AAA261F19 TaxID=1698275 RepID=A0A133VAR4_9EURY|nr:hypothetical protein AKJ45_01330 [candidate division MSBL1 archaeon SCGC-AAA261F19]
MLVCPEEVRILVKLDINEKVSVDVSKDNGKYFFDILDTTGDEPIRVGIFDTYKNLRDSKFARAQLRNEIRKYHPNDPGSSTELDRQIMQEVLKADEIFG